MDPAGILMLRSVRVVFEKLGVQPETIKFKREEFNSDNLVKALNENPKKCPAIVTSILTGGVLSAAHIMVATNALKGDEFIHEPGPIGDYLRNQWFINCKNSYRDDPSEPGIVLKAHLCDSFTVIFAVFKREKDTLKIPLKSIKTGLYADDTGYRFGKVSAFYISIEK